MALLFSPAHKTITTTVLKASLFYMIVFPWLQESPYWVSYQNSPTEFPGPFSSLVAKVRRGKTHKHLKVIMLPSVERWSRWSVVRIKPKGENANQIEAKTRMEGPRAFVSLAPFIPET